MSTRSYQFAIEAGFGLWRPKALTSELQADNQRFQFLGFHLNKAFSFSSALECCALMAALDVQFSEVIPEIIKSPEHWRRDIVQNRQSVFYDIPAAREELLRRKEKHPGSPPSVHRRPYWFLRLNDPDWLKFTFPRSSVEPIPAIDMDRVSLERIAADEFALSTGRKRIEDSPAGLRAMFRDQVWLQSLFDRLALGRIGAAEKLRQEENLRRSDLLLLALSNIVNSDRCPERIYAPTLAASAGLSHAQASHVVRTSPALRLAIHAANASKHRRQVFWAARQLHREGQYPSLKAILRRARLPTLVRFFDYAREALSEINAEKMSQ